MFQQCRVWTVQGLPKIPGTVTDGLSLNLNGETCIDFKNDDNELWCKTVRIPDCVDRTILCSEPPSLTEAHTNQIAVKPQGEAPFVAPPEHFTIEVVSPCR